jgi:hypothetical protein
MKYRLITSTNYTEEFEREVNKAIEEHYVILTDTFKVTYCMTSMDKSMIHYSILMVQKTTPDFVGAGTTDKG